MSPCKSIPTGSVKKLTISQCNGVCRVPPDLEINGTDFHHPHISNILFALILEGDLPITRARGIGGRNGHIWGLSFHHYRLLAHASRRRSGCSQDSHNESPYDRITCFTRTRNIASNDTTCCSSVIAVRLLDWRTFSLYGLCGRRPYDQISSTSIA